MCKYLLFNRDYLHALITRESHDMGYSTICKEFKHARQFDRSDWIKLILLSSQ